MSMKTSEWFKDKARCYQALVDARKIFGSTKTTNEQYEKMLDMLRTVFLYCPNGMKDIVMYTIEEAELRKEFLK